MEIVESRIQTEVCLLGVPEVARRLGISCRTLYNALSRGDFPIKRKKGWGRRVLFSSVDVNEYILNMPYLDEVNTLEDTV
jgi:excisionase family DNA binding protein